jgi:hypothetical protein
LEIDAKLSSSWTMQLSGAYTDAVITSVDAGYKTFLQSVNPGGAPTCRDSSTTCYAPILNVPKETANLTLVYSKTVNGYTLSARATDGFVGPTVDEAFYFGIRLPSYNLVNTRIALAGDKWQCALFINNVTDKVAEISSNNTSFQFNIPQVIRYSTNQPRTFGTQIDYRF